jgi:hypothetical protein
VPAVRAHPAPRGRSGPGPAWVCTCGPRLTFGVVHEIKKMFTTSLSFIIVGIAFFLLSLINVVIWSYFIPCSLILALLWLRIYNFRYKSLAHYLLKKYSYLIEDEIDKEIFLVSPSIFLPSLDLITIFARLDFSSSIAYSFIISVIYGIISLVRADWVVVFLCVILIHDSIRGNMRDAFEAADHEQNILRVVHRYLKSKKRSIKEISDVELNELAERYEGIINRLKTYAMT